LIGKINHREREKPEMSFIKYYQQFREFDFELFFSQVTPEGIRRVLSKSRLDPIDLAALLAPAAESLLEEMAQKAHRLTLQHFGRAMLLYTPLYLSDYCINHCSYCGFSAGNKINRQTLTLAEVKAEAEVIAATGLRHILLLTGESRRHAPVDYIAGCIRLLKSRFSSIGIEIYPLTEEEYRYLAEAGADSLTIYQEVYDTAIYDQVHLKGPKQDYLFRLEAPERGCRAGLRAVNVGALLGLADWRRETFFGALHALYMQNSYPEVEISYSVPRLRPYSGKQVAVHQVTDRNLVQILLSLRLFMPRLGLTLSTRERSDLRDKLISLGITKMSAASCTSVGGRTFSGSEVQFVINDERGVAKIRAALSAKGYDPVFKDWHQF